MVLLLLPFLSSNHRSRLQMTTTHVLIVVTMLSWPIFHHHRQLQIETGLTKKKKKKEYVNTGEWADNDGVFNWMEGRDQEQQRGSSYRAETLGGSQHIGPKRNINVCYSSMPKMFSNFQVAERSYYALLNPHCPWNIDYFPDIFGWVVSKTVVVMVTQINDLSTLV